MSDASASARHAPSSLSTARSTKTLTRHHISNSDLNHNRVDYSSPSRRFPPLGRSIIVACEIDPPLDRHEADNGLVPRCERLDGFSAVIVRFAEGVWFTLGRERGTGLGKCNPAPLAHWQCRQGAAKRGFACAVELRGIGRIAASPE